MREVAFRPPQPKIYDHILDFGIMNPKCVLMRVLKPRIYHSLAFNVLINYEKT